MKELIEIQNRLNAPKDQYNAFGKYNYRNCESILAAVKPLLKELGCILLLSDDVKEIGSTYHYASKVTDNRSGKVSESLFDGTRVYVVATATLINSAGEKISVSAMAREDVAKAGMDVAQVTGSASSYARKYALNGLFAIDDNKDADTLNTSERYTNPAAQPEQPEPEKDSKPVAQVQPIDMAKVVAEINAATGADALNAIYKKYPSLQFDATFLQAISARGKSLGLNFKKKAV